MFEIGISHFLTCDKVSWNNDLYQWTGATKPNGTTTYTSNGLNQYTAVTGVGQTAFPPVHDANGNLTAASHWTYTYDSDNRLKTAISTDLATPVNGNLTYDAQGRLRQTQISIGGVTKTSQLLYDGVDLVAEYDAVNTLQRRYVHGPGVDEPLIWYVGNGTTAKSWLYADHLGSIIATANASGASSNINTYGPFGESAQTTPDNNRFGYTGQQQLKGLGLNYYKARVYSPALGRFLQTDPIGYADDLNLYGYVGNSPINATDPWGLEAQWLKGATLSGGESYQVAGGGLPANPRDQIPFGVGGGAVVGGGSAGSGGTGAIGVKIGPQLGGGGVRANNAAGAAFENQVMKQLLDSQSQSGVVQQLTVKTQSGVTTRIDLVGRDSTGKVVCTECKASATAPLTPNQKAGYPEIQESGAQVIGKGKPGFPGGTQIPPTKVDIVRP